MKHREHFTLAIPRYITVSGKQQWIGDLLIDGIAYCRTREDVESYNHDIEAYRYWDGEHFEQCTSMTKGFIETGDLLLDIEEAVTAHVAKIWGNYEPAVTTTDIKQIDYLNNTAA